MSYIRSALRAALVPATLALAASCANSNLGSILGSVLGGGNSVSGTVQSVDTRNQQLYLTDASGQSVVLSYDANTQNRSYGVGNLERGDQVTATVSQQQASNGATIYYASSINVDQPVAANTTGTVSGAQAFQGTARQINRTSGTFQLDTGTGTLVATIPYNASSDVVNRFNQMRNGDFVHFYGVVTGNNTVTVQQFY
jgi:ABC-type molybdate transport system ATPase subunit